MPRIVPGDIFAMLRELDGEATEGGFVSAGHIAFDDGPRLQAEIFRLLNRVRIEQRGDRRLLGGFLGHLVSQGGMEARARKSKMQARAKDSAFPQVDWVLLLVFSFA